MKRIQIGTVEVFAFNDFSETTDAAATFPSVTREEWEMFRMIFPWRFQGLSTNIDPWDYCCYVIRDDDTNILIDLGVGGGPDDNKCFVPEWKGTLLSQMAQCGIAAEDINIVFPTHIHPDHIGWGTVYRDGAFRNAFPNAIYMVQQADWNVTADPAVRVGFPEGCFETCLAPVMESGALKLTVAPVIEVSRHVRAIHIPGHTPGICCFVVEDEGMRCLLTGDMLADPLQIYEPEHRFVHDMDSDKARIQRKKILDAYAEEGTYLGACHFGLGRIIRRDGRRIWINL